MLTLWTLLAASLMVLVVGVCIWIWLNPSLGMALALFGTLLTTTVLLSMKNRDRPTPAFLLE
jgi:CHASE2 domain-containing sensor protein